MFAFNLFADAKQCCFILCEVKAREETGERRAALCSKIRDELSLIQPGQLHPFGRHAAMSHLRGASDTWISLAEEEEEEEAQMGTERRPLPGFKKLFFYIHQTKSLIFSKSHTYLKATY